MTARHFALAALVCGAGLAAPGAVRAATLQSETAAAWRSYVAATEARIDRELQTPRACLARDCGLSGESRDRLLAGEISIERISVAGRAGEVVEVPDGLIHHWHGTVFLHGMTLDTLLDRLQHPPERGPHQEDVVALRVLDRRPDALRLSIRMTRRAVVTVTYDTEHQVTYRRHGPFGASSRSIATRIVELENAGSPAERAMPIGKDRGFMWRLNSYWRYEQVDGGVVVELESLTLSRNVPRGLRFVVAPLIDRVARESMARTLDHVRRTHTAPMVAHRDLVVE